jgi:hypothetical protein
LHLN